MTEPICLPYPMLSFDKIDLGLVYLSMTTPHFIRKGLFWEVSIEELDTEQNKGQIVNRVATRGTWEDFKELLLFYGKETVLSELLKTRYLDDKTLNFCAFYFQQPISAFRCYQLKQSLPQHFSY